MKRIEIRLSDEEYEYMKRRSAATTRTMSEMVRHTVRYYMRKFTDPDKTV